MAGKRYPKSWDFVDGELILDGHFTADEIWAHLLRIGVSPAKDVKVIKLTNVEKGVNQVGLATFTSLEKIVIGSGVPRITPFMFDVDWETTDEYGTTKIRHAFHKLREIDCGGVSYIEPYTFWRLPITKVTIGDNCRIGPRAFLECKSLKDVVLGKYCVISERAFSGCPIEFLALNSGCGLFTSALSGMKQLKKLQVYEDVKIDGRPMDRTQTVNLIKINKNGKIDTVEKANNYDIYAHLSSSRVQPTKDIQLFNK